MNGQSDNHRVWLRNKNVIILNMMPFHLSLWSHHNLIMLLKILTHLGHTPI